MDHQCHVWLILQNMKGHIPPLVSSDPNKTAENRES